jgi:hypothetical protein
MNELVKLLMTKAGLSEVIAKTVIEVILGFVKDKLPKPLADQVVSMLGLGGATGANGKDAPEAEAGGLGVEDVLKGLGGMFGGKS